MGTALGAGVLNTLQGNIPPEKHMRLLSTNRLRLHLSGEVNLVGELNTGAAAVAVTATTNALAMDLFHRMFPALCFGFDMFVRWFMTLH
ncbi:hypothetical protein LWI29_026933 [Acer saccharum]|uniref:Uncharacterized protein n=1 Tax=Acer saccharum TaxID=4024 RepID=A0AA39VK14_ACESA|nr:hypothetical protein LWI29_026933 [Acer saccharum]